MANTYTKIYLHIVFAVKNRQSLLPPIYLPRIHAYIGGILKKQGHFPYAVGGIDTHVHVLAGYNVNVPVPEMVRDLKSSVSRYINQERIIPYRFEWQGGYACFSYSQSQVEGVVNYIRHQHEHHKNVSLEDEIALIMKRFEVEYDCRYIMRDPE